MYNGAVSLVFFFRSGLAGLARRFKIMDDNNNCVLEFSEFLKAMREVGIVLTDGVCNFLIVNVHCYLSLFFFKYSLYWFSRNSVDFSVTLIAIIAAE
jgi:hypothetical protein